MNYLHETEKPVEEKKPPQPAKRKVSQPLINDPKLPPLPDGISKLLDRGQKSKKFDPSTTEIPVEKQVEKTAEKPKESPKKPVPEEKSETGDVTFNIT